MKKLIIHNMSFKFNKQENYFFRNATVEFTSGAIYFIQGKNGIGKSTFFSILQGTTPQDSLLNGTISFDGRPFNIHNNRIDARLCSHVKTVVQDVSTMIVTSMSVIKNIQLAQLGTYPRLIPLANTIAIPPIMHEFGISETMSVQQLSGGQKQILAIMMTLQKPTQILLLDEPTAALDEKNTHMVIQFLTTLAHNLDLIIIIITHDKELTSSYPANHNITIQKGANETRTIELCS